MLPITYSVEGASTDAQVLRRLSSFLDYLCTCHIDSILPQRFSGLAAHSADEVRAWAAKLAEGSKDSYCLTAAGRCWLEEIRDAFAAAACRLDEISRGTEHSTLGIGPMNRSVVGMCAAQS